MRVIRHVIPCVFVIVFGTTILFAASPANDQLSVVRQRIDRLENDLERLAVEAESTERERRRLDAELELADARVREVELLLERSGEEAKKLREEAAALAIDLDSRREALDRHLEIMVLLGRPGPMQLFVDATGAACSRRRSVRFRY